MHTTSVNLSESFRCGQCPLYACVQSMETRSGKYFNIQGYRVVWFVGVAGVCTEVRN